MVFDHGPYERLFVSDNLLRLAEAEEQQLLAQLRLMPLYRKLQAIKSVIAAYQGHVHQPSSGEQAPVGKTSPRRAHQRRTAREGTQAASNLALAESYLNEIKRREQTPDLFSVLIARGGKFNGKKPQGALASLLSHSDAFNHVRGKGYGLSSWGDADGPPNVQEVPDPHPAASAEQPEQE